MCTKVMSEWNLRKCWHKPQNFCAKICSKVSKFTFPLRSSENMTELQSQNLDEFRPNLSRSKNLRSYNMEYPSEVPFLFKNGLF